MKNIKSIILTMLAVFLALPASAETIVDIVTTEDLGRIGITSEKADFPAGTVILDNDAATLELAYADQWGTIGGYGSYSYRSISVGDSGEIGLDRSVVGNTNPTFINYEQGVMSAGAVFELKAKRTGWMTILLRMHSNKQYVVFEGRTKGIPYTLGMAYSGISINYSLPAIDYSTIDFNAPDASKYFIGDTLGGYRPQFPTVVAGLGDPAEEEANSATGFLTFRVTAGNDYYFSAIGSRVGCSGIVFTDSSAQPTVTFPESDQYPEVTLDSVIKLSGLAEGDDFEYEGVWYTVLDAEAKTCKTKDGIKTTEGNTFDEVDEYIPGNTYEGDMVIPSVVSFGSQSFSVVGIGFASFANNLGLTSVKIPDSVTWMNDCSFLGCKNLQAVHLPNTIRTINNCSFYACENLIDVVLPQSLTVLKHQVFTECSSLKSVKLPDTLEVIESQVFRDCKSLESIEIPPLVSIIQEWTFLRCSSLSHVGFPEGLTSIGEYAFQRCDSLTAIDLPKNLSTLGKYAFSRCPNLKSVSIPESITSLEEGVFWECTALETVDLPESLLFIGIYAFDNCPSLKHVNWPHSLVEIQFNAFSRCSSLESIDLPESLVSIGEHAFQGCTSLKDINLPSTLRNMGMYAFSMCQNLKSVSLPESIASLEEGVFWQCDSLASVNLPNSLLSIGKSSFAECPSLELIELPASVNSIGEGAFHDCTGLRQIKIPSQVTTISDITFARCSSLESVELPAALDSIGEYAFQGCTSLPDINLPQSLSFIGKYALSRCLNLKNVDVPESITSLEEGVFWRDSQLEIVNLPNTLRSIGLVAFRNCSSLTDLNLPASLRTIDKRAFQECSVLKNIVLPESLTALGDSVFVACYNIENVEYLAERPIEASSNVFSDVTYEMADLNMPNSTLQDVTSTTPWNLFSYIHAKDGATGPGAEAGTDFQYEGVWYTVLDAEARTCKTKEGNYDNSELLETTQVSEDLIIPSVASDGINEYTVVGIGSFSFKDFIQLASVSLPNSLKFIESHAFSACKNLASIKLPSSLEELGSYFIASCPALTEITIPEKVTVIPWGGLDGCISLEKVTLPEGLTEIEVNAFIGCSSLARVNMPESLRSIGGAGFMGCRLSSIELPGSLEYIGEVAFEGNPLVSVTIPASLLEAGVTPFSYCVGIREVTYLAEKPVSFDDTFFDSIVYGNATLNAPYASLADIQATVPWNLFNRITASDGSVGFEEAGVDFEYEGILYTVLDRDNRICKTKDEGNIVAGDIVIPEEAYFGTTGYWVMAIGERSFAGSSDLTSISLSASLDRVGEGAFDGCDRLTSLIWRGNRRMQDDVTASIENPNLLVYVDSVQFAPEGLEQNVVADGVCDHLVLTPGCAFRPYADFTARTSKMTKEFTQQTAYDGCAGWESIVLPFDVTRITSPEGHTLLPFAAVSDTRRQRPFWLYEADPAGEWTEASSITAGMPYIISMPNNPRYNPAYNINGAVTFSNPTPQRISRETATPNAVTWATGREFRSLWLPLTNAEASNAMGLNAGMDGMTDDHGSVLAPGSAFCAGVVPQPLEAYVSKTDRSRAFLIKGLQTAVLSLTDDDGLTIAQEGGTVVLKSGSDRTVEIYSADGTLLRRVELKGGEAVSVEGLPQGVCLIAGRKVMIR